MLGLLLQAILFFITAMSTKDIALFFISFSGILVVDSFWLLSIRRAHADQGLLHQWLVSNALLLAVSILLALSRAFIPAIVAAACLAIASLVATVYDYSKNKDEYFPPERETVSGHD
jgi:hypothetical protein